MSLQEVQWLANPPLRGFENRFTLLVCHTISMAQL